MESIQPQIPPSDISGETATSTQNNAFYSSSWFRFGIALIIIAVVVLLEANDTFRESLGGRSQTFVTIFLS
ncbi:MAG: hypothetical protein AAF485_24335, partial [Chloroflexota bacterium]